MDHFGRATLFVLLAAGLTLFFVQSLRHQRKLRPERGLEGTAKVLRVNSRRQQLGGGSSSFDSGNGFGSDGIDADDALGTVMALGAVADALDRRIRAAPPAGANPDGRWLNLTLQLDLPDRESSAVTGNYWFNSNTVVAEGDTWSVRMSPHHPGWFRILFGQRNDADADLAFHAQLPGDEGETVASLRIADASGRRKVMTRTSVAPALRNPLVVVAGTVGAIISLVSVVAAAYGESRFFIILGGFSLGLMFLFGIPPSRVLRAGISRTPTEIVCRYIPWYQGNFFLLCVALPLLGISALGLGFGLGVGGILDAIAGIVLLALTLPSFRSQARLWRRCQLRIGRSELAIEVIQAGAAPISIPRQAFQAIDTKTVDVGTDGSTARYLALVYGGGGGQPETIQIGRQTAESGLLLSVKLQNLERALAAWKDGGSDDPELLDRVEAILRCR